MLIKRAWTRIGWAIPRMLLIVLGTASGIGEKTRAKGGSR